MFLAGRDHKRSTSDFIRGNLAGKAGYQLTENELAGKSEQIFSISIVLL